MITGTLRIDLTALKVDGHGWIDSGRIRHLVDEVTRCPSGARVVLVVGRLRPHAEAVRVLHEHVERLHLDVQGAAASVVEQWRDSVLAGEPVELAGVW